MAEHESDGGRPRAPATSLEGKVALVSGGARGLGEAEARLLAEGVPGVAAYVASKFAIRGMTRARPSNWATTASG